MQRKKINLATKWRPKLQNGRQTYETIHNVQSRNPLQRNNFSEVTKRLNTAKPPLVMRRSPVRVRSLAPTKLPTLSGWEFCLLWPDSKIINATVRWTVLAAGWTAATHLFLPTAKMQTSQVTRGKITASPTGLALLVIRHPKTIASSAMPSQTLPDPQIRLQERCSGSCGSRRHQSRH